jgi:hypothetical protein
MSINIGGFICSPPDPKDLIFANTLLPKLILANGDIDLEEYCTDVSDQFNLSSCVSNAAADAIELCNGVDGIDQIDVSRLQIYFNGRSVMTTDSYTNESNDDGGMYIRAAFKAMVTFGICPEAMWPYDSTRVNERPNASAIFYALKNKLHSYYSINTTGANQLINIKQAIQGSHPTVFGIPVTEAFRNGSTDVIPPPKSGEKIYGLHGIMGMGCIAEAIKIRNSWGRTWSVGGYARLHQDWFNLGHVQDPWVPTRGLVFTKEDT